MSDVPSPESAPRDYSQYLRHLPRACSVTTILLIPSALVWFALKPGEFLFGLDVISVFYHLYGSIGNSLADGRLPVWDSHSFCGSPLLAAMQGGVFYPPTWLATVLDPGTFCGVMVALHLSLSGFFAEIWLRRGLGLHAWAALGGSLVFMLSGFIVTHLYAGHMPLILSYPWAAALLWRLERMLAGPSLRRALCLAATLTLMIFAGFPHLVFITGIALAGRCAQFVLGSREGRGPRLRAAAAAIGALGLGVLMAAPQLLPTLELIGHTQRISVNRYGFVTAFSFPPSALITLVAPDFLGNARDVGYWGRGFIWETFGFVGLSTLALASLGVCGKHPQRRLWLAVAVAGVLLGMGRYTPVFRIFFELVPGASLFRAPGRYFLLFTLSMSALGAMGLDRFVTRDAALGRHAFRLAVAGVVLLTGGVGLRFYLHDQSLGLTGTWTRMMESEGLAEGKVDEFAPAAPPGPGADSLAGRSLDQALLTGGALIVLLSICRWTGTGARWLPPALCAAAAVELLAFGHGYFRGYPRTLMGWPASFVQGVRRHPGYPFRMASVSADQSSSIGLCRGADLEHVGGYDPMMLLRYAELNASAGAPVLVVAAEAVPGPLFDLMGARYWITSGPSLTFLEWKRVDILGTSFVYENPRALPRSFRVVRSVKAASDEQSLRLLGVPSFDPSAIVILDSQGEPEPSGSDDKGETRLVSRGPGRYELETTGTVPAWLVLTEAWYPGWSVRVDGRPANLLRADHLFQAVHVPAGTHAVEFSYRSRFLGLGFALAAAAALIPLAFALSARFRRTAPDPSSRAAPPPLSPG
jgi:hypothetical protein